MKGILEVALCMGICNVEYVTVVLTGMATSASVRETLQSPWTWMRMPAGWTITLLYAQDLVYVNVASVLVMYVPIHMR